MQLHGGEACDFKTTMVDTIEKTSIQVSLSSILPLILARFAWGLKQTPRKNDSNRPIVCDLRTKIC